MRKRSDDCGWKPSQRGARASCAERWTGRTEVGEFARRRVHVHLLHLEAVELLLDLLREDRREAVARRRLGAAVVDGRRPRRVHREVAREHDAAALGGRGGRRPHARQRREVVERGRRHVELGVGVGARRGGLGVDARRDGVVHEFGRGRRVRVGARGGRERADAVDLLLGRDDVDERGARAAGRARTAMLLRRVERARAVASEGRSRGGKVILAVRTGACESTREQRECCAREERQEEGERYAPLRMPRTGRPRAPFGVAPSRYRLGSYSDDSERS